MSEFISICPKCHQQILGDTEYIGKQVACPICLQEITMPAPQAPAPAPAPMPGRAAPAAPPPQGSAARSYTPPPASRKPTGTAKKSPIMVIGIAVGVLVLAGVGVFFTLSKSPEPAKSTPPDQTAATPRPTPPAPVAPKPAAGLQNCRALWTFDDGGGSIAVDHSGARNNAILSGRGANWSNESKVGTGSLSLTRESFAQASGPVVNTAESFTAAAWVKFDTMTEGNNQTLLSIDGENVSGFYLQLHSTHGERVLVFNRHPTDDIAAIPILAKASANSSIGVWYHVTGVYDADAKTMSLYVNGRLQQTTPCPTGWQAKGDTAIGRGLYHGKNVDFVTGLIDDARIYNVALHADQIEAIVAARNGNQ